MPVVGTEHFLEEHNVGAGAAHRFAQFGEDEAAVKGGKTLVGVDGQHLQALDRCSLAGGSCMAGVRFSAHGDSCSTHL
ncbi:hypothetical protein D3C79_907850 [compost metagenome]